MGAALCDVSAGRAARARKPCIHEGSVGRQGTESQRRGSGVGRAPKRHGGGATVWKRSGCGVVGAKRSDEST